MNITTKTTFTAKHWFGYMYGEWGAYMTYGLMGSHFTFYCIEVLGVEINLMTTLMVIWFIWEFIHVPIVGFLLDMDYVKKHFSGEKYRPWLRHLTMLLAVTAMALWIIPSFCNGVALIAALLFLKILYETTYSAFIVTKGALVSAMAGNDGERAALCSAKSTGSMVGGILVGILVPFITGYSASGISQGYLLGACICALIGFLLCRQHYAWSEERVSVGLTIQPELIRFTDIRDVFRKNSPFTAICICSLCLTAALQIFQTMNTYMYLTAYNSDYIKSGFQLITDVISFLFLFLSICLLPRHARKSGLEPLTRRTLLVGGCIWGGLFVLQIVTVLPLMVHSIMVWLGYGMVVIALDCCWSLIGKVLNYNEYLSGKHMEKTLWAIVSLFRKIGMNLGILLTTWSASQIDHNGVASVQSATRTKIFAILVPALFILAAWAAVSFFCRFPPKEAFSVEKARDL